ncbi:protein kinase [Flavobacterium sp.]|jgi:hypothetical protein|uniref:protein kinase n=1 Tax=Flavobacterium sp. TaxID=239 RepID=UPI0037C0F715
MNCKDPICVYSDKKKKCVKPNPYFEALAWCKRQGIDNAKCKKGYFADKKNAREEACKRYEEKMHYVKPEKKCPDGKVINPKTGRCIKIKVEKEKRAYKRKNATQYAKKVQQNIVLIKRFLSSSVRSHVSTPHPNISSMKPLSNFSSIKPISSSSKSSQYSKVFKQQYKEKKNAKFIKNGKANAFQVRSTSNPLKKKVTKDTLQNMHLKKIKRRQSFIKDMYNGKMKDILEKDRQNANIKQSLRKSFSSTSRKVRDMQNKVKLNKVKMFLKHNLIKKYYNLDKRVNYYNYVRTFTKNIGDNACLQANKKGYTIDGIIILKEVLAQGVSGIIYKTGIKNMLGMSPIATKLVVSDEFNKSEVDLNSKISEGIVKNKLSRHFLLTYKTFECKTVSSIVPKLIAGEPYFAILNEMAHGDLENLLTKASILQNDELVLNIAVQCMLATMTFHQLNYIHHDLHSGNFLYHKIEEKPGYYHYKIFGKSYYLKSCGYTMMIYDFGMSYKYKEEKLHTNFMYIDYDVLLDNFQNKADGGASEFNNLPHSNISLFMHKLQQDVEGFSEKPKSAAEFNTIILGRLLDLPIHKNIFTNILPTSSNIINDKPFIIDKDLVKKIR